MVVREHLLRNVNKIKVTPYLICQTVSTEQPVTYHSAPAPVHTKSISPFILKRNMRAGEYGINSSGGGLIFMNNIGFG